MPVAILAWLARIWAAQVATNSLLSAINTLFSKAAVETTPNHIENMLLSNYLDTHNEVTGFGAAYDQRVDILSRLTVLQAAVDAIPTGPQLASDPVILPTTPPTGYGGSFGDTEIDAIWAYQYPPGSGNIVGDKLIKAGRGIEFWMQDSYYPSAYNKYLGHHFDTTTYGYEPSSFYEPNIDPTTILSTDASIVAWLNRTTTGFTWTLLYNQVISYSHIQIGDEWWICTLSQAEFEYFKTAGAAARGLTAPIWPGEDNVTFTTAVPLLASGTIEGPMHGVVILLNETDPHKSFYQFDDKRSYRNIGAVAFENDDEDVEQAQSFGFMDHIIVPKTMAVASKVHYRSVGIIDASIYTWSIIS